MGPLFSLLLMALVCVLCAAAAYAVLKISRKHKPSLVNVLGVVGGGIFGGVIGVLFNVFFLQVRNIETTAGVVAFLASLILSFFLFSFFGFHLAEKIRSRNVQN